MADGLILIVDDEPSGRQTLEALLSSQGYDLCFAENGRQALQAAQTYHPSIVLLDVMMPDMDGYAVCRRLRLHPETAGAAVVITSALDDASIRSAALNAGADDVVTKPFDVSSLRSKVRRLLAAQGSSEMAGLEGTP